MNYNPVNKLECYYGSIRIMLGERKKNKNKNCLTKKRIILFIWKLGELKYIYKLAKNQ
jgi:hypothetical protein